VSAAEIARALGLRRAGREFAGKCPSCGYATGFSLTYRNGVLLYHCHGGGCSQSDVREALKRAGLAPCQRKHEAIGRQRPSTRLVQSVVQSARPDKSLQAIGNLSKARPALVIWQRSRLAEGTAVETYLHTARGYTDPIPRALRFTACKHPSDGRFHPAMIAIVVIEGCMKRPVAVHRTFLRRDGKGKTDLDPNKMTLGPCKGAAVPLAPAGPMLAVAEGIETALSYMQATGIPTWAALSAGGMRNLVLPEGVLETIIAADPDPVGLMAARAAARRWLAEGRKVSIARPTLGLDFNDILRAAG
jgi:putative DNA primase/helicase